MEKLMQDIRAILAEITELDEDKITPEANLVEDLGADSMMALEIVAAIEKKYQIQIPEEMLPRATSLGKIVELTQEVLDK